MLRPVLLALGVMVGASCVLPDLDLEGRPCPCADGYVCDSATNECVKTLGGSGGSGAAGAGPSVGGGAVGGMGGSGDCSTGRLDCDVDPSNGCETDPNTDVDHCGGCDTPCALQNVVTAICNGGTCDYDSCAGAFDDCDGDRTNGCERPTNTLTDCGGCDVPCAPSNAIGPTCDSGACDYASCSDPLVGDCDGDRATGCEQDLGADLANCGACNAGCNFACSSGTCPKTVFVTSEMTTGDIGGIAGADTFCQTAAGNAGLKGTFYAWLSDDTSSPASHFIQSQTPYELVNGTVVANNWADLIDGIAAPITVTEVGGPVPIGNTICAGGGFATVWTNTTAQGLQQASGSSCSNWASTAPGSAWGQATDVPSWTSWCSGGTCSWVSPLYCFQQ